MDNAIYNINRHFPMTSEIIVKKNKWINVFRNRNTDKQKNKQWGNTRCKWIEIKKRNPKFGTKLDRTLSLVTSNVHAGIKCSWCTEFENRSCIIVMFLVKSWDRQMDRLADRCTEKCISFLLLSCNGGRVVLRRWERYDGRAGQDVIVP